MGMLLENESMGGIPTPGTGQDLASGAAVLSAKAESAWLDNPSQAAHLQTVTGWVREWRNHPSLILWSTDNESGSQSGAADPDVFKFQRRIKQGILALDPTRPVDHQGSPLTSAAKKFGVDIVPDIYNIHPYADPITLDVDKFSKRHFYSGQPIFIGELFNDYPKINFTPADMAQRPKEVWEKTQSFTEYWHRNILAAKKAGYAGTVLLSLAHSAFWGYIDDKHWVGSPFGRTQGDISVPWPSLSGPDPKIAIYTDWIPWDNLNWFDTTRPVFTPTHVFNRVRDAYRQINGGDLPALPNTRNPELIVTLRYKSKPLPEAVVYLIPADSQPVLPVGVRTDAEGKAWFQADTPGRYNLEYRGNSQVQTLAIDLPRGAFDGKPGYHHVKFLTFDISGPPAQLVANVPDTAPASEPDVIWKCLPVEEKPKAAAKIHDAPNYIDLTAAIDEDGNLSKKAKAFGLKVFLKGKEVTHTLKPWGAGIGIYPDSSKHDTFELFMPAGKPGRYELIVHDPLLSPELSVDLYVGEDQKPRLTLNTNAADLGLQFAVARRGAKFILTLTQKDIVNGKVKLRFVATCWCPAYLRGLTLKLIS